MSRRRPRTLAAGDSDAPHRHCGERCMTNAAVGTGRGPCTVRRRECHKSPSGRADVSAEGCWGVSPAAAAWDGFLPLRRLAFRG